MLSLTCGSGGVDAQDWTEMLLRMYTRWAESGDGYRVSLTERTDGDEAGIKSATLTIEGAYACGCARLAPHNAARISTRDGGRSPLTRRVGGRARCGAW